MDMLSRKIVAMVASATSLAAFDKTVTGRTIVIEPKYGKGTATLTVKATRADGTVFTAQKTLVNTGGDSPDPADSLSLSG